MNPEEAEKLCEKYVKEQMMTAILEAYRLGQFRGMTRAAEICEDIKVNGKGGAPTCHQAILTERDRREKG